MYTHTHTYIYLPYLYKILQIILKTYFKDKKYNEESQKLGDFLKSCRQLVTVWTENHRFTFIV